MISKYPAGKKIPERCFWNFVFVNASSTDNPAVQLKF